MNTENIEQKFISDVEEKGLEPIKVELVDDDYLSTKKKEKKLNFIYDTPGILNESQVSYLK